MHIYIYICIYTHRWVYSIHIRIDMYIYGNIYQHIYIYIYLYFHDNRWRVACRLGCSRPVCAGCPGVPIVCLCLCRAVWGCPQSSCVLVVPGDSPHPFIRGFSVYNINRIYKYVCVFVYIYISIYIHTCFIHT